MQARRGDALGRPLEADLADQGPDPLHPRLTCNPSRAADDATELLVLPPQSDVHLEGAVTTRCRLRSWWDRDAPSARAASLASSTACLSHPMSLWPGASTCPRSCTDPYARDWHTDSAAGGRITLLITPPGASRPKDRSRLAPRGSGAAAPYSALRAIESSACLRSWRAFGPPRLRRHRSLP